MAKSNRNDVGHIGLNIQGPCLQMTEPLVFTPSMTMILRIGTRAITMCLPNYRVCQRVQRRSFGRAWLYRGRAVTFVLIALGTGVGTECCVDAALAAGGASLRRPAVVECHDLRGAVCFC